MIDTNSQNDPEFAAFVGIDWADQKHAWALQCPSALKAEWALGSYAGSGRDLGC